MGEVGDSPLPHLEAPGRRDQFRESRWPPGRALWVPSGESRHLGLGVAARAHSRHLLTGADVTTGSCAHPRAGHIVIVVLPARHPVSLGGSSVMSSAFPCDQRPPVHRVSFCRVGVLSHGLTSVLGGLGVPDASFPSHSAPRHSKTHGSLNFVRVSLTPKEHPQIFYFRNKQTALLRQPRAVSFPPGHTAESALGRAERSRLGNGSGLVLGSAFQLHLSAQFLQKQQGFSVVRGDSAITWSG